MQPQISIIVPVYKSEQYIDRCVQSILQQTFRDFELILVDDGSPDACPRICDAWSKRDGRIKVIHKTNGGAGSARNAGLAIASGNYIAFVDSDDWIDCMMYQTLIEVIQSTESEMAICDMCLEKNDDKFDMAPKDIKGYVPQFIWSRQDLLDNFFRIHGESDTHSVCNRLIHKDLLNSYCFIEGRMNEDVETCYRLSSNCEKAVYIQQPLYHYRINVEGVTRSKFNVKKLDLLYMWEIVHNYVKVEHPNYCRAFEMNEKRARFTLLSQMVLNGYDHNDDFMVHTYKMLKSAVRSSFWELLKWNMPLSRKILLIGIVI